ncbi:MAG: hypothetical protein E7559_09880 [Ruminococcaceae bacterium]|nr:hypothetical protein [Oscillospiraceae bacterium]
MNNTGLGKRLLSLALALMMMLLCAMPAMAEETGIADTAEAVTGEEATAPTTAPTTAIDPEMPIITYATGDQYANIYVTVTPPPGYNLGLFEHISYRTDGGEWSVYSGPVVVQENCLFEAMIVRLTDHNSPIAIAEITNIDTTPPLPPEIIADTETWVSDNLRVVITSASDVIITEEGTVPGGSGFSRVEYRLGAEGAWHEYSGEFTVSSPVVLYARSVDMAGNCSEPVSIELNNFDFTPPDCSGLSFKFDSTVPPVQAETGTFSRYYRDKITVSIDGAADTESGLSHIEYQTLSANSALTDDGWKKYDPAALPVISGDFCGYVYARAVDKVGNISVPKSSDGIVLDNTAPIISGVTLSTTQLTDSRVVVTFSVTDNVWLDSVTVNDQYVGVYDPTFTAFRNNDYVIKAVDKSGNVTTHTVTITNINGSAFNLLSMYNSLVQENFTPSTWAIAQTAASELQGLITVGSGEDTIAAASEKLVLSLEGLVVRGDGTASLRLIEKVDDYDSEKYTESSWKSVADSVDSIRLCLADPERTQEDVDKVRHNLENAITALTLRGDFTNLDRLIAQCEALTPASYDPIKFSQMREVLSASRELSRTDSSQQQVDDQYRLLLEKMSLLREIDTDTNDSGFNFVMLVVIALLLITIFTVVFIVMRKLKAEQDADDDEDYDEEEDERIGDFVFTDDEVEEVTHIDPVSNAANNDDSSDSYIGRRRK